jgi:hypothetical protein
MSQQEPWYQSNRVVWVFLMFPIVGYWLAYFALSGGAQHGARVVSTLAWVGIMVWMGNNGRSATRRT